MIGSVGALSIPLTGSLGPGVGTGSVGTFGGSATGISGRGLSITASSTPFIPITIGLNIAAKHRHNPFIS